MTDRHLHLLKILRDPTNRIGISCADRAAITVVLDERQTHLAILAEIVRLGLLPADSEIRRDAVAALNDAEGGA